MNTPGFHPISEITRLPLDTLITLVVGEIEEIQPAHGDIQNLRLRLPSGLVIDTYLYDRATPVLQANRGGVLRARCSPTAKSAIRWERSRSEPPGSGRGVLSIRKQASLEVYTKARAAVLPELAEFGFVIPSPLAPIESTSRSTMPETDYRSAAPSLPAHAYNPALQPPLFAPPPVAAVAPNSAPPIGERAACFAHCLASAKMTLGHGADPEDVRFAAKAIYDSLFARV